MMPAPRYKPSVLDDPQMIAPAAENARLIPRIRNLFELEGRSIEPMAEAVEVPRGKVI